MKKILVIDDCMQCLFWTFENKDYCKKKKRVIPDYAREFPKWCPLKNEKKFTFLRKLLGGKDE